MTTGANQNLQVTVKEGLPIQVCFPSITNVSGFGASDFVFGETPTPAPDGINTVFTVANPYISGKLRVYRDQSVLVPGVDFTESSSTTFTTTTSPDSDEKITVDYIKQ